VSGCVPERAITVETVNLTLTQVSLYLNGILVDGNGLSRCQSSMVLCVGWDWVGHELARRRWMEQDLTWQPDRVSIPRASAHFRGCTLYTIAQDHKMSDTHLSPGAKKDTLPYSRPVTPDHGRRIGIYGLGAIGYNVARNLVNSPCSLPLVVYNRTTARSEKLASELGPNKISVAQSPVELVNSCDIMWAPSILKLSQALTCLHQFHDPCER
jgi:hypothetical protein